MNSTPSPAPLLLVSRDSAVSLREQVERLLRRLIADLGPGGRLPAEQELTAELGVSRTTVRLAMRTLMDEALIVRRPGLGTFVQEQPARKSLDPASPFLRPLNGPDQELEIEMLEFRWDSLNEVGPEAEDVSGWIKATRAFRRDGAGIFYSRVHFPEPVAGQITRGSLEKSLVYDVLRQEGFRPASARFTISCPPVPAEVAPHLDLHAGDLCLHFFRTVYDRDQRLLVATWIYLRPEEAELVLDTRVTDERAL